jgi:hypothetical protein
MSFNIPLGAVLLALAPFLSTNAQNTGTRSTGAVSPTTTNFDRSVVKLLPNFTGHDIKTLYKEMSTRSAGAKKGEFETTEEFRVRVQRENAAPVLGNLDKNGIFAFTIENYGGETLYDADQRIMTVGIRLSDAWKDTNVESDKKALTSQSESSEETYEGSNAYGAKVQVTRLSGKHYEVAFSNSSQFGMTRSILIQIPMEVSTAKNVKDHLKSVAVVRLLEPYTFEGVLYDKPTLNLPKEHFYQFYYLNTELLELWVYDDTTGQIFAKKKP